MMRGGRIVAERYGSGQDWKWNKSLGLVAFGPGTLHDIRSISKSVTSLDGLRDPRSRSGLENQQANEVAG